jgi:hypothetical protein
MGFFAFTEKNFGEKNKFSGSTTRIALLARGMKFHNIAYPQLLIFPPFIFKTLKIFSSSTG